MNETSTALQFGPLLFLPLFALFWLLVSTLLSYLSGWHKLATRLRATQPANGERFSFVSASMGKGILPVRFNNCLFLNINNTGFRLSILFLYRFQCPPLFFPWSEVESVEEKRQLFGQYMVIRLKNAGPLISIRGRVGQTIKLAFDAASAQKVF